MRAELGWIGESWAQFSWDSWNSGWVRRSPLSWGEFGWFLFDENFRILRVQNSSIRAFFSMGQRMKKQLQAQAPSVMWWTFASCCLLFYVTNCCTQIDKCECQIWWNSSNFGKHSAKNVYTSTSSIAQQTNSTEPAAQMAREPDACLIEFAELIFFIFRFHIRFWIHRDSHRYLFLPFPFLLNFHFPFLSWALASNHVCNPEKYFQCTTAKPIFSCSREESSQIPLSGHCLGRSRTSTFVDQDL